MDPIHVREPRALWSFWIACGMAATAGLAPLLFGVGSSNRISTVFIPFLVAAIALGSDALLYQHGRPVATMLYFVAGLAIVYGMLAAFSVPLRLAVVSTCPAPPTACPSGLEPALTSGESTGLSIVIVMGLLAMLTGFFGLLMLYRRSPKPPRQLPS